MELTITDNAVEWYKEEFSLDNKQIYIRLFPRYGTGGHIPGFSIGISNDEPNETFIKRKMPPITFYIEKEDAWYFKDIHLVIEYNKKINEPEFIINKYNNA